MIIEPTPTTSRTPLRRAAGVLGLVTPVVLLAAVVAGGLLGRADGRPGASTPATATAPTAARARKIPASPPPAADDGVPAGDGAPAASPAASPFPAVVANLAVRTVDEALSARGDRTQNLIVAVSGYLGRLSGDPGCADRPLGPLGPLCTRSGVLAGQPWATSDGGRYLAVEDSLRVDFPAGVQVPDEAIQAIASSGGASIRVVLLGRFRMAGVGCGPGSTRCVNGYTVDRIAWVDGAAVPVRAVMDTGVDGSPPEWILQHQDLAQLAAIGWSGDVLVAALLRPPTLASVDPNAARATSGEPRPLGLVWYVRGLEGGHDPIPYPMGFASPRLSWVVLDDVTGMVLARGSAGQPTS
jgi:hypothetical protein